MSAAAYTMEPHPVSDRAWTGDRLFLIQNLIAKDFKVRYRNMSLGVFWSLLNPLVMMGVLWFVFTKILPSNTPNFGIFTLCGIVPFNVFTISWLSGTTSVVENAALIKRVLAPREIVPIAAVLGNGVHLSAQVILLLLLVVATGGGVNRYWWWLLALWPLEIVFVTGLALMFSALNVFIRDIRYVVESANVILFWLVPIFYDFSIIPDKYHEMYQLNPVAALVLASRDILLKGSAPPASLLVKLAVSSTGVFILGFMVFRRLQSRFFDRL